jgi:hypothetical protein
MPSLWMALASCRLPGAAPAQTTGPPRMDGLRGSSSRPGPARLGSLLLTPASSCLPAALARLSPLRDAPRALRPLWRRPRPVRGTLACCVRALRRLASCCPRRRCIATARTGATAGLVGTPALLLLPVCGPAWRWPGLCSLLARCVMRLLGSLLLLGSMKLRSVGCPRAFRTGARYPRPRRHFGRAWARRCAWRLALC